MILGRFRVVPMITKAVGAKELLASIHYRGSLIWVQPLWSYKPLEPREGEPRQHNKD